MKVNTTIGIQLIPISKIEDEQKYQMIDKAIYYLQSQKEIKCVVGPLETTIEGEYDKCMDVLNSMIKLISQEGITLFVNVKIIHNPKQILSIDEKTSKFK